MTLVLVPAERVERWVENFAGRHGPATLTVADGALTGRAEDGSRFTARLPFDGSYAGPADAAAFAGSLVAPDDWGVLLVRKGGFAIARLHGPELVESKVGQRHVQGRTKAGGYLMSLMQDGEKVGGRLGDLEVTIKDGEVTDLGTLTIAIGDLVP